VLRQEPVGDGAQMLPVREGRLEIHHRHGRPALVTLNDRSHLRPDLR
jgi:hypothetical protein